MCALMYISICLRLNEKFDQSKTQMYSSCAQVNGRVSKEKRKSGSSSGLIIIQPKNHCLYLKVNNYNCNKAFNGSFIQKFGKEFNKEISLSYPMLRYEPFIALQALPTCFFAWVIISLW